MSRRVVLFLLHVPKCAGTTVEAHFRAVLGPGFLLAPRWHNLLRSVIGNRYSMARGDPRLGPLKAITGHSIERTRQILDTYIVRTKKLSKAAIIKLQSQRVAPKSGSAASRRQSAK